MAVSAEDKVFASLAGKLGEKRKLSFIKHAPKHSTPPKPCGWLAQKDHILCIINQFYKLGEKGCDPLLGARERSTDSKYMREEEYEIVATIPFTLNELMASKEREGRKYYIADSGIMVKLSDHIKKTMRAKFINDISKGWAMNKAIVLKREIKLMESNSPLKMGYYGSTEYVQFVTSKELEMFINTPRLIVEPGMSSTEAIGLHSRRNNLARYGIFDDSKQYLRGIATLPKLKGEEEKWCIVPREHPVAFHLILLPEINIHSFQIDDEVRYLLAPRPLVDKIIDKFVLKNHMSGFDMLGYNFELRPYIKKTPTEKDFQKEMKAHMDAEWKKLSTLDGKKAKYLGDKEFEMKFKITFNLLVWNESCKTSKDCVPMCYKKCMGECEYFPFYDMNGIRPMIMERFEEHAKFLKKFQEENEKMEKVELSSTKKLRENIQKMKKEFSKDIKDSIEREMSKKTEPTSDVEDTKSGDV